MKIHLKFKESDKPVEMGLDHIIEYNNFKEFINSKIEILKNPVILKDGTELHFTKEDNTEGIAYLKEVEDSFTIENIN